MQRVVLFVLDSLLLLPLSAGAQEIHAEFSLRGAGYFTNDATGDDRSYRGTWTGGLLASYRYHLNRWLSLEGSYGFDRNTQKFLVSSEEFRIQSHLHQVTGGLVVNLPSVHWLRVSPYLVAGGGALVFAPTSGQFGYGNGSTTLAGSQTQTKPGFTYGVGFNYPILKHVSLRVEYRGLVYRVPDYGFSGLDTNSLTHTAEPSLGLVLRF